jgi:glycosyltransferase involved in cell wall biosynthesis
MMILKKKKQMDKIKILFVIENIFFGGGERAFAQIINALDKTKYEIYVACFPGGHFEEQIKNRAKLLSIDLRNRFNLTNISKLARLMRDNKVQIVHTQGGRGGFFARTAAKIAKVPVIISTIAMPVEGFNVGIIKKSCYMALDRFSERYAHRFIAVSEALKQTLIENHKIPSENVVTIYNGIEIDKYTGIEHAERELKEEFNISPDNILIGYVGRLTWQKGLKYFIEAMHLIKQNNSDLVDKITYLIVGEGEEKACLEKKVADLKLKDNVIFAGFRQDIKKIISALNILVLPSLREGQPIILLEAMAVRTPIIASDIEGIKETIEDKISGFLVNPRDPHAIANAIVDVIKNPDIAWELVENARKTVEQKFNLKDKIAQHERLYESLIAKTL